MRALLCRNPQCREPLGERYGSDRLVVPYGAKLDRVWVRVYVVTCPECGETYEWRGIVAQEVEERAA